MPLLLRCLLSLFISGVEIYPELVYDYPFHRESVKLVHGQLVTLFDILVRSCPAVSLEWLPAFHDAGLEMHFHFCTSELIIGVVEPGYRVFVGADGPIDLCVR